MSPEKGEYIASFEYLIQKAKEITLQDGNHVPVLIVEGSRGLAISQMRDVPDTHDERLDLMRSMGQAAAMSGKLGQLRQVFFISEGWMSEANGGKPPDLRPSQDPNRKEVLIVSGLELKGQQKYIRIFEMIRNPNQRVVDLSELSPPHDKGGMIEIPLLDAFAQGFRIAFQAQAGSGPTT
jgi:hypothetical protein